MRLPFGEIFVDETRKGKKLSTDEYRLRGRFPIVDQGASFIAGYTDCEDGLYTDVPVFIFGDHTRCIKFVDFPFFPGADGVKILKSHLGNADDRYLYYALKSIELPNTGYNRHFKWLKETSILIPELHKQKEVVAILDLISKIIKYHQEHISKLDELVKARFVEMFGNPLIQDKRWKYSSFGSEFEIFSGGTPPTSISEYWDNGTIPWMGSNMCQDAIVASTDGKYITEDGFNNSSAKWAHAGYVLVALVGATIGKTALLAVDATTNQNVASINVPANKLFTSEYVYTLLQLLYVKFKELGDGGFKMANLSFVRQLPLPSPPVDMQRKYSLFVQQVDKSKVVAEMCGKSLTRRKRCAKHTTRALPFPNCPINRNYGLGTYTGKTQAN